MWYQIKLSQGHWEFGVLKSQRIDIAIVLILKYTLIWMAWKKSSKAELILNREARMEMKR